MWKGDQDLGSLEGMTPTGHHWWYLYHPEWMTSEWAAAGALVSRSDWEVQATIFDYEKLLDRPIKKKGLTQLGAWMCWKMQKQHKRLH